MSNCEKDDQGNVISWDKSWSPVGDVSTENVEIDKFCEDTNGPNYFLFPEMSLSQSFTSCQSITGYLPSPESKKDFELYKKEALKSPRLSDVQCTDYWVGATDLKSESKWTGDNGKEVSMYWSHRQPDGLDVENCAVMRFGEREGVYDTFCTQTACAVCVLNRRPIWSLMGSCEKYQRNRHFAAMQSNGNIIFKGYSDYEIFQKDDIWVWNDRRNDETLATLISVNRTSDLGLYPFGRKVWKLNTTMCNKMKGEELSVLLTPCKDDQFTCNDASCIPLWQRCDLKPNCKDQSDEQNCRLIDIPRSYRADIPPLSTTENTSLPISLGVVLESIDIHTADMRMHVNINLTMSWRDNRVQYRNLNEDRTLNR